MQYQDESEGSVKLKFRLHSDFLAKMSVTIKETYPNDNMHSSVPSVVFWGCKMAALWIILAQMFISTGKAGTGFSILSMLPSWYYVLSSK